MIWKIVFVVASCAFVEWHTGSVGWLLVALAFWIAVFWVLRKRPLS